jgi:uncharacterized membrane protein YfcA
LGCAKSTFLPGRDDSTRPRANVRRDGCIPRRSTLPRGVGIETVFSSPWQLVAVGIVLVAAEAIYVLLGFGAGLVAIGALALLLPDVRDGVVLLLLVNLPAELFVVFSSWRDVNWRGVAVLMVGIAVGIPAGAWLLGRSDPALLLTFLGAVLMVVGAGFLCAPSQRVVRWPRWAAGPVGLSSGLLTGLFGTGGPPLVLYYQLSGTEKAAFRGNLMAIFLLMTLVRVPSYAGMGLITAERLWSSLVVLPAVLAGAWLGNRLHLRIEEETFRRLVAGALVILGALLIVG